MDYIEKIKKPILAEMQEFERIYSEVLKNDNELLVNVHNYIMAASGKRLRPILTILAAKLLGEVNQATLYGAFSLELLHTASLVHDDVIDDTLERRGRPSVNARWTNKIAVLTGDYILSKSLYCANKTKHLDIMEVISLVGMVLPDDELSITISRSTLPAPVGSPALASTLRTASPSAPPASAPPTSAAPTSAAPASAPPSSTASRTTRAAHPADPTQAIRHSPSRADRRGPRPTRSLRDGLRASCLECIKGPIAGTSAIASRNRRRGFCHGLSPPDRAPGCSLRQRRVRRSHATSTRHTAACVMY